MDQFPQQSHTLHPSHEIRGPHEAHLTAEQAETLNHWLGEKGKDDSLSVREIADFADRFQPVANAIIRSITSVSVGRKLNSPSITHAVALLGTRHTLSLLWRLVRRSGHHRITNE